MRAEVDRLQALPPPTAGEETLDLLLDVPELPALAQYLPPDTVEVVRKQYRGYPVLLRKLFDQYREPVVFVGTRHQPTADELEAGDKAIVLIDILPQHGQPATQQQASTVTSRETLIHAYNKLKHRFLITPSLRPYSYDTGTRGRTLSGAPGDLEVGWLPIDEEYIHLLLQNVVTAGKAMADLAHLLLVLDSAGVDLYS